MVYRVYVEKKTEYAHEAMTLLKECRNLLGITSLVGVRLLNRYDAENMPRDIFDTAVKSVFSEPQTDLTYEELEDVKAARDQAVWADGASADAPLYVFAVEYLPGQFNQRADSAAQCIQFISGGERADIASAKVYLLYGSLTEEEIAAIWKKNISATTVVGLVSEANETTRIWLPIHGMDQFSGNFSGLKVETAIYTLRDYRDAQPFRDYFLEETDREKGNPSLYLDTAEADRIRKMANLLSTLYPIALGVALLLGGVLPGLMVLQNSRETAILRVLGMSRKRVCAMLTGEQVLLCIIGLVLGVAAAFLLGAGWELTYPGLHLAACLIGSIIFAWVSTGKDLLSLLQAKE